MIYSRSVRSDDDDENWQPKLFHKIKHGQYDRKKLEKLTPHGKDIVEKMLEVDPSKRLSASEALKHAWIVTAQTDNHLSSAHEKIKSKVVSKQDRNSLYKTHSIMDFLFRGRASLKDDEAEIADS